MSLSQEDVDVVRVRLPHLIEDQDRHGNTRRYVRKPGLPRKIRIRPAPGDPLFLSDYNAALEGRDAYAEREAGKSPRPIRLVAGTREKFRLANEMGLVVDDAKLTLDAAARAGGIEADAMRRILSGGDADCVSIEDLQRLLEALRAAARK